LEGEWYGGIVEAVRWLDPNVVRGFCGKCRVSVLYDDGDLEELALEHEKWRMGPPLTPSTTIALEEGTAAKNIRTVTMAATRSGRVVTVEVEEDEEETRENGKEKRKKKMRGGAEKKKGKGAGKGKLEMQLQRSRGKKNAVKSVDSAKDSAESKGVKSVDSAESKGVLFKTGCDGGDGSRECRAGLAELMRYLRVRELRLAEVEEEMLRLGLWQRIGGGILSDTLMSESEEQKLEERCAAEFKRRLRPVCEGALGQTIPDNATPATSDTPREGALSRTNIRRARGVDGGEVRQVVPGVYCSDVDVCRLDADLDVYVNGDITAMEFGEGYVRSLLGAFAKLSSRRQNQFHAVVRHRFFALLDHALEEVDPRAGGALLGGAKLSTDETRPWGYGGEEVRCYAIRERSLFGTLKKRKGARRREGEEEAEKAEEEKEEVKGMGEQEEKEGEEEQEDSGSEAGSDDEDDEEGVLEYYKRLHCEVEQGTRMSQAPVFEFTRAQLTDALGAVALDGTADKAEKKSGSSGGVTIPSSSESMVNLSSFGQVCNYRRCTCKNCGPPFTCRTHKSLVVVRAANRYTPEMCSRRMEEDAKIAVIAEEQGAKVQDWLSSKLGKSELKKACVAKKRVLKAILKTEKAAEADATREHGQTVRNAETLERKAKQYMQVVKKMGAEVAADFSSDDVATFGEKHDSIEDSHAVLAMFASVAEADLAVESITETLVEVKAIMVQAGKRIKKVAEDLKAGKTGLEAMVEAQALAFYVAKASEGVVEQARCAADEHGLQRPWDGFEGKRFDKWCKKRQEQRRTMEENDGEIGQHTKCNRRLDTQCPDELFSFEFLDWELRKYGIKKDAAGVVHKEGATETNDSSGAITGNKWGLKLPSIF
jgi:hypothetical protein